LRALGDAFDRRLRIGQDLRIVLVGIDDLLAGVDVVKSRIARTRLPMSLYSPATSIILSKNFFGKKWVYASIRM
jgi:hypothetical protein